MNEMIAKKQVRFMILKSGSESEISIYFFTTLIIYLIQFLSHYNLVMFRNSTTIKKINRMKTTQITKTCVGVCERNKGWRWYWKAVWKKNPGFHNFLKIIREGDSLTYRKRCPVYCWRKMNGKFDQTWEDLTSRMVLW